MINKRKELEGFRLINILEHEEDNEIKILSTLDMIDYFLRNNVKSKIIPAITELDEENNHYLYFNAEGNLSNKISKDDLDRKYAVQTKESKYMNALDMEFKEDSLWAKGREVEGLSIFTTLDDILSWINKVDNQDVHLINEVYHINDNGCKKILAERIKKGEDNMELNITDLNTIAMIDKMMEFEVVKEITSNNNEISLDGFKHNGSYSIIVSKLKWAKESKQYEYDVLMVIKPETWKILKGERFTFKVDINKDELPSTERDKYQWLSHKYVDFLDNVCISPIEWININQIEKRNNYNNSRLITIYSKEYNVIYDTVE